MNGNAKFSVLLGAKVTGENNIKRLGNSMQGVQGKAKNLGLAVKGVGLAFKAMFAAAAIGGIAAFAKSSIDAADALGKLEVRTGIAAAKLQSYVNAGKLADVSQKQLATGLKTLARTQLEAADGVATYADAYNKLGIDVKNTDGTIKKSDQLLGEIADAFATLPDGPEKTAIALDIFGKSGADMITMLNGGKAALEEFNYQLSDKFAQNAEYYNDQVTKLGFKFEGFRMQLIDALLPALNAITESFATLFEAGVDFDPLFKIIAGSIRVVAAVTFSLIKLVDTLIKNAVAGFQIIGKLLTFDLPGAMDIYKTRFSGMIDQAKKDFAELGNIMFGTSEAPEGYGRKTGGVLPPGGNQELTKEQATKKRNSALSKGLDITLKQTASFAKMLQGLEDERRLLEAKILGKEKEIALDIKVEKMTKGLPPEIAAGVEQRIRGNAELQNSIDKTKELNAGTEKTNGLFESIKSTVATGLANAIEGLIDGTKSLSESLSGILKQMASLFLKAAIGSFGVGGNAGTGLLGLFANGGVVAQNKVVPFASGGIVSKPTVFPMANGMGLMGEAGPEAIMPLKRGRGGRLGVEVSNQDTARDAMSRYSNGSRGNSVIPANGGGGSEMQGSGGGGAVAAPIDVRYTVERINSVDYITADQFQTGMRSAAEQGAKRGEQNTLKRLQMSGGTRKRLGL